MGSVFAPGFDSERVTAGAGMLRIMFIYIVFISISAVFQGILNYNGIFGIASFTPILLNLVVTAAAFTVSEDAAATAMSWGVFVGGILQMAVMYPAVRKLDYRIFSHLFAKEKISGQALRSMLPGVCGAGIYQINVIAGNYIASSLGEGAISALTYSNRLLELALGIFVVSLNTVFFPGLSKALSQNNPERASEMTVNSLNSISFFTVPVIIGLMLTGEELIKLLFERGKFDAASTQLTFSILLFHTPGMIFIAGTDALQRTPEYIKYWAADPQRNAFQTDAEREEFIKRETESISGYQSFIVSFHNPGKGEFRADKSKELNIFLQYKTGDGTNKIYPADIRRLKNDHEEVRYLQKYLVGFDRFSEVYLISFPQTDLNANTALPEQTSDSAADKALNLVISHLKGYTIISFT
ncbi:hypothetical protein CHS0354_035188 [Potamilus streckersoni]|uniref:Uncharacterized protein n=1 Tax=Potamilus streckersoni TaxID=2493646 RepID=A0AAE0S2J2_9BIVA|nr:hypothetical protein CHS0354_035188 [Potamilus streckersoni]